MLSRSQKRVVLAAAILVIVVLFVVPFIRVSRYKLSIANALSQTLGRDVSVQDVSLQTFPQPGLLLTGVVIGDDPSISSEPMLRAEEVLATIRVTSLWRWRLEIATLKLKYPSVNLVRANDGRWNIESLLEQARRIPSAPTGKKSPERKRARFPYIEADTGRINLKIGNEKKVFALSEADFSLWQDTEDQWRMRLKARPIRTDANLTDTGTIKMEGDWHRAATLHATPLQLRLWWEDGQLGQLTSLAYGRDRGWRGSVRGSAVLDGTPDNLKISLDARLGDFRRYDIATSESVTLQLHCDAQYSFSAHLVNGLGCLSPFGGGLIQIHGGFGILTRRDLDLSISAENISAQSLALLLRHMKKNVPEDVKVSGMASVAFTVRTGENGEQLWAGNGQSSPLRVQSSVLSEPLHVDATRWHLIGPGTDQFTAPANLKSSRKDAGKEQLPQPADRAVAFEPVTLALGGPTPTVLSGWFARDNFLAELKGEVELDRLVQVARLIGLPTVSGELAGDAKGRLQITGRWSEFALPEVTGQALLHGVTAKFNGVANPLKIQSAQFVADATSVSLSKAVGSFVDMHSALEFSATWPRNCAPQQSSDDALCGADFNVKADQINLDELNSLLNPRAQKRPWYAALANTVMGSSRKSLPDMYAKGQFSTSKLIVKNVTATHVFGNATITPTGFALDTVNADVLGGKFVGDISGMFTGSTPGYASNGNIVMIGIANVAALTRDAWGSGKVTASYKGTAAGWTADEIIASLRGTANFQWRDGTLHHMVLDGSGKPLQFKAFSGKLELAKGVLSISESKLQAPKSIYEVSGTASLGRELELKLERDGAPGFSVSGTLEKPKVSQLNVPDTQAALK